LARKRKKKRKEKDEKGKRRKGRYWRYTFSKIISSTIMLYVTLAGLGPELDGLVSSCSSQVLSSVHYEIWAFSWGRVGLLSDSAFYSASAIYNDKLILSDSTLYSVGTILQRNDNEMTIYIMIIYFGLSIPTLPAG
jgi:hypothetical protein